MKRIYYLILISIIAISGCGQDAAPTGSRDKDTKPVIYTTFYPTKYFAERIGGESVEVVCPVPADEDAIFWKPGDAVIGEYQTADMIIINGAGFSKWVSKTNLPQLKIVNSAKALKSEFIQFEDTTEHSHGAAGKHAHEGLDGHTWVDPINAIAQAGEIEKAMSKRFPDKADVFEKGFAGLKQDLEALDKQLKKLAEKGCPPLLMSHPAYNYIVRRYKWNVRNLDLDPEAMPSDETIKEIKEIQETHEAKTLVWESQPTKEIADRMKKELGLTSVVFSPCELLSADEIKAGADYLSVMKDNLKVLGEISR